MSDTFFRDARDAAARASRSADTSRPPTARSTRSRHASTRSAPAGSGRRCADLATWSANFDDDRLTDGWLPERLTTRGSLDDGTPIHYAWGLSVRTHRGLPIVSHGGNFPGWESKMVRFPTERTTVIVLANREDLDVERDGVPPRRRGASATESTPNAPTRRRHVRRHRRPIEAARREPGVTWCRAGTENPRKSAESRGIRVGCRGSGLHLGRCSYEQGRAGRRDRGQDRDREDAGRRGHQGHDRDDRGARSPRATRSRSPASSRSRR